MDGNGIVAANNSLILYILGCGKSLYCNPFSLKEEFHMFKIYLENFYISTVKSVNKHQKVPKDTDVLCDCYECVKTAKKYLIF